MTDVALATHPVHHDDHSERSTGQHQAIPQSPLAFRNSSGSQQPNLYAGMAMNASHVDPTDHSQMHTAMSEGASVAQLLGGRPSNTQRRRWDDPAEVTSAYPAVPDQPAKAAGPDDQQQHQQGQFQRMMQRQRTLPKHPSGGTGPQYYPAFPRTPEEFQDCCDADQAIDGTARVSAGIAHKNPTAPLKSWDSTSPWLGNDAYPDKDTFHTPTGPDHGPHGAGKAVHDSSQGVIVHMSRAEAWARFTAYEACIQVCFDQLSNDSATYFTGQGFKTLKEHMKLNSLLLTGGSASVMKGFSNPETNFPDICWQDSASGDLRMMVMPTAKAGLAGATGPALITPALPTDHIVRIRVGGVALPGTSLKERVLRWASKRHPSQQARRAAAEKKNSHLMVYMVGPDGHCMMQCPVDRQGCPINTTWSKLDQAGSELRLDLHSRVGLIAGCTFPSEQLWHMAQQVDIQDWSAADPSGLGYDETADLVPINSRTTATMHVSLKANNTQVAAGQVLIEIQRIRRPPAEVELAQAGNNPGIAIKQPGQTFGTKQADLGLGSSGGGNTVRMNKNIAYDYLLSAALEVERCGPSKLTIEGPWQWLLTAYADRYHVTNPYRVLVHLQWILQPSIARTSCLCLTTICDSWSYLLSCKHRGELTPHEDTLLTRIRRDVEELLKVAFTRYYIPQQQDEDDEDDPPRHYELQTWDPTHLQAAVQLYQQVSSFLAPSPQEWLGMCWQTAAQKRWKALMAIGDPDRLLSSETGLDGSPSKDQAMQMQGLLRRRPLNNPHAHVNSGIKSMGDVKVYQLVISLCRLIQEDITFDLHLKREPGLLPVEPELPRKTADEYLAQFLQILRMVLDIYPPTSPTPHAVDLLVAVASMQRYLDVAGLQCDKQHPSHLNAYQLFQPHVLRWISASQQRLSQQCQQLEASSRGQANQGLWQSNASPLVATMVHAVAQEQKCYERVLQHWPRFAPPLEAAVCQVLRVVLSTLLRQCETVQGNAASPTTSSNGAGNVSNGGSAGNGPAPGGVHQRSATAFVGGATAAGGRGLLSQPTMLRGGLGGATMHRRNATTVDVAAASALSSMAEEQPGPLASRAGQGMLSSKSPLASPRAMYGEGPRMFGFLSGNRNNGPGGNAAPPAAAIPRMIVLLKEAVLLNSLKHIMVLVPDLEDSLTQWATWAANQAPITSDGQLLPDGVDIGVHFAQLVKELRTEYATAVATAAGRLMDVLRGPHGAQLVTNIRVALDTARVLAERLQQQGYQQMSSAQAQKQALEEALSPVLAGLTEAMAALRAALDVRVCIATGRALWDYVGKDLHLFVSALQETGQHAMGDGTSSNSAWRARQNADSAAHRIDELFCQTFTELVNGAVQPCDLQPPAHMDKVHKLLQRNSAAVNLAFIPF